MGKLLVNYGGWWLILILPSIFGKTIIRMAKNRDKFFRHSRHFRHNGKNSEKIDG